MKVYAVEKEAVLHNARLMVEKANGTPIWAVLKGDGYGLGAGPMAELCWQGGIRRFAIAEPDEATVIRERYADAPILMLRPTTAPGELEQLLSLNVIATIGSCRDAAVLNRLAGRRGVTAHVHVKIDTGMGRYGFLPSELEKIKSVYRRYGNLTVTGIYTHFHSAFCNQKATMAQYEAFQGVLTTLAADGLNPGMAHCCSSTAFLRWPELKMDAIRTGSALLGRVPVESELCRVGCCEATVDVIRLLPAGHSTGYGACWKAKHTTRVAILSVGWYHGFANGDCRDRDRVRDCLREILGGREADILQEAPLCHYRRQQVPHSGSRGHAAHRMRCNRCQLQGRRQSAAGHLSHAGARHEDRIQGCKLQ